MDSKRSQFLLVSLKVDDDCTLADSAHFFILDTFSCVCGFSAYCETC